MIIFEDKVASWIEEMEVFETQDLSLEQLLNYYTPTEQKPFGCLFSDYLNKAFTEIQSPGAVLGAIGNAIKRGNKSDPTLPLSIIKYIGKKGVLVTVEDVGSGFDVEEVQRKYNTEEKYFQHAGNGWKAYSRADVLVQFEKDGRKINLYYPFSRLENEFYSREGKIFPFFDYRNYAVGEKYWFRTNQLFVKGKRLRSAGEIYEGKTTPAIFDISKTLQENEELQTEPLWVYHDRFGRDIVYEGRHRVLGYLLAEREHVPGMIIAENHPKILSKRNPAKVDYYRKRMIPVTWFLECVMKSE
ncbi:MAG: hypothetical protein A2912_04325 [Candidatus Buchananbacteria bacterium RIFCSPLOWO2_01_FULL_40_23b]|uniref:Histidine kinase/HSP90-like ATPase domain-containing protein n=1 Tax=Candidatus Buchananbacteria bacterium RIFCSPLOWO2_01_FULL_40_23b TaxID=1797544 RepID=A0A1G1YLE9_9BACT|nr:MAG: hypothetical protein A2912_04325 [Candidatus Buchananbacteria bacterium RIFCSPLOWO2_01_FULL_40_23b]